MIKKYAKYFTLLYVFLILDLFPVDGIGNPFDQGKPQKFLQSKIVEVRLDMPNDTIIVDPFMSVVKLYVFTNDKDTIWGTQNPFADSLIHFSLNHTYSWDTGNITAYDDPSNRYDCYSSVNYFLNAPLNILYFHASYIENDVMIDTIVTIPVYYTKPLVNVDSINDIDYNNQTVVVNSNINVNFKINLNRAYQYEDPAGYDKIVALEANHNGTSFTPVWNDPQGVRNFTVTIPLSLFTTELTPGYNTFEFRAKGKCASTALDEYSEIITVKIFYLDFEWDEELSSPVCRDNTVYELNGIPEGGYFSGEGIISSTTLFNPSQVSPGTHTITYHYLIEGSEYTVGKNIEITALPDFTLTGDREVCLNEYDVVYQINSITPGDEQITWEKIEGGEIQSPIEDQSQAIIHWNGIGSATEVTHTGKIIVKIEINGCVTTKEFLVDIGNTKAPDTSFMILYNNNLLLCSDTSANFFFWYYNDVLLQSTEVPYYFLGASFIPTAGDEFYVMTAYELNDAACLTQSNIYKWPDNKKLGYELDKNDLIVYPNPNDGNFTVMLPYLGKNEYRLTISDMKGEVITSMSVSTGLSQRELMIHGQSWQAGIYLLRVEGNATALYKKIVITK